MAQRLINLGTPNGKDGDIIRDAFNKVNLNFTDLFSTVGQGLSLPEQTDKGGRYLRTSGAEAYWTTIDYADVVNTPNDLATTMYVNEQISQLIDGSPIALDTLRELAAAINDNSDLISTINSLVNDKANTSDLSAVAFSGDYNDLINQPDVSGYATISYVNTAIENSIMPDLSGYATISYVDSAVAGIPAVDLTNYATKTYVDSAILNSTVNKLYVDGGYSATVYDDTDLVLDGNGA